MTGIAYFTYFILGAVTCEFSRRFWSRFGTPDTQTTRVVDDDAVMPVMPVEPVYSESVVVIEDETIIDAIGRLRAVVVLLEDVLNECEAKTATIPSTGNLDSSDYTPDHRARQQQDELKRAMNPAIPTNEVLTSAPQNGAMS